ncbi:cobalamin biosynthesis protein CbiX [Deinococcus cavernae]|uniref:Cobalamin biosynthesis protein CbiX n=1 Tax=Deinococcus cavernae TaxID=2320857 RepID=A0A418VA01_9DEIO|nr:DR2241 family protein [Deinococcus cavernae]RJF72913.1 cobalamin biosynthesis protein CbiX [Deinococcus cavernae]
MRSLVLVGHGSHVNSRAARSVYRVAEELRQLGSFSEVIECFWKEEPSLRQALRVTGSTDVTVVPFFLSDGYFTDTVIPRELGLGHQGPVPPEGIARVLGGKTVRYLPPYGSFPGLSDVLVACAREALPEANAEDVALVLLGHPSARRGGHLERHAQVIREARQFAEVQVLYLEDHLAHAPWLDVIQAEQVVVVPFFSDHALSEAAPPLSVSLGVQDGQAGGKSVTVAPPVGTHPGLARMLAGHALNATQDGFSGDADRVHLAAWTELMQLARRGLRLGEAVITPQGTLFDLRNALDEGRPSAELTTFVTVEGLRDTIRVDDSGAHRPVRTFRNLPRHWRAVFSEDDLPAAIHALYPATVEEAYSCGCHSLRSTPWPTTARRQTGIYARVQKAAPAQVEEVARRVCSRCLRTRLWASQPLPHTFLTGVPGAVPCAEACTYLIAAVREHLAERPAEENSADG